MLAVVFCSSSDNVLELRGREMRESFAFAAHAHLNACHHRSVKLKSFLWRCHVPGNSRASRHHTAADVIPHRSKAKCTVGDKHTANGNSIAYVHIRCDADKFDTWKLCGVDDLLINIILDLLQELGSQEQAHRDIACLFGCKCEVSIFVYDSKVFPNPI